MRVVEAVLKNLLYGLGALHNGSFTGGFEGSFSGGISAGTKSLYCLQPTLRGTNYAGSGLISKQGIN